MISVVIPTRNRPELLARAVQSALSQTFRDIEVIVVVDGPDPKSVDLVMRLGDGGLGDERLRCIVLPESQGANAARNAGAEEAEGDWIAFLDDDDEWLPNKLECQVAVLAEMRFDPSAVVSCRFIARTPAGDSVWPRRLPEEGESVGDYAYNRRSLFNGETALNTSTLLVAKELAVKTKFSVQVRRHQELDFLLRASDFYPLKVRFAPECLAVWNTDDGRRSITNSSDWSRSMEWVRGHRGRLTRPAYSGFLLISLASESARGRTWTAFIPILREAITYGQPTLRQLGRFLVMWFMPSNFRRWLRIAIREHRTINQNC